MDEAFEEVLRLYKIRNFSKDYAEFERQVQIDLLSCGRDLEELRKHQHKDEDGLTATLVIALRRFYPNVHHTTESGGHVDLRIGNGNLYWLAEAKLCNGKSYLLGGLRQIDKYFSGHNHSVGVIVYIVEGEQATAVTRQRWKQALIKKGHQAGEDHEFGFETFYDHLKRSNLRYWHYIMDLRELE